MTPTEILNLARERFDLAYGYEEENRLEALEDLKFSAGDQWPDAIKKEREAAGRPTLTIDKTSQFVRQVTGNIRQNRPSVKVKPVDSGSDPDVAEIYSGIIRHIEQRSDAQSAYITAAESAATCGIGHFRILTEYADDESFEQDIRIKRIRNPFAVYWDTDAEEVTKHDAKWCFVTERISLEAFKERYPKGRTVDFESESYEEIQRWWDGETVRIAEYWIKTPENKTIALFEDGTTAEFVKGMDPVRTRQVTTHRISRYVINGVETLEGPEDWFGKHIPVIPVVGEEIHVGDKVVRRGIVRGIKDSQRMLNYWRTTSVESIALAPKAPYLVTPQMIEGYKPAWESANKGNPPYLLYNPDSAGLTPKRESPPAPPSAMWQEANIAGEDMKSNTGIYDASLGAQGNETSGRAILARQQEGDTGTFVYADNLSRAIRHAGVILIDLIPKVYDSQRVIRIIGEDDMENFVTLNEPVTFKDGTEGLATIIRDKSGGKIYKPPLDVGKYDVEIITGPSYATKRIEAADSMMQFIQAFPAAGAVVGDLIARNMDWPGAEQIAERLKKALPPGLADDEDGLTPEEQQARQAAAQQQQQQQEMQMQIQLAQAQGDIAKSNADAEKAKAAAAKDMASIGKTEAETEGERIRNAQEALTLASQNGQLDAVIAQIVQDQVQQILSGRF